MKLIYDTDQKCYTNDVRDEVYESLEQIIKDLKLKQDYCIMQKDYKCTEDCGMRVYPHCDLCLLNYLKDKVDRHVLL